MSLYHCNKCQIDWKPRKENVVRCPTCHSIDIELKIEEWKKEICKKCQWQWVSIAENPKVCPKCKSIYWNKEKKPKKSKSSCGEKNDKG